MSINMKGEVTFIKIEKGKDNSHGGVTSVLKIKTIVNNKVLIDLKKLKDNGSKLPIREGVY